jgi:hypothetical protein
MKQKTPDSNIEQFKTQLRDTLKDYAGAPQSVDIFADNLIKSGLKSWNDLSKQTLKYGIHTNQDLEFFLVAHFAFAGIDSINRRVVAQLIKPKIPAGTSPNTVSDDPIAKSIIFQHQLYILLLKQAGSDISVKEFIYRMVDCRIFSWEDLKTRTQTAKVTSAKEMTEFLKSNILSDAEIPGLSLNSVTSLILENPIFKHIPRAHAGGNSISKPDEDPVQFIKDLRRLLRPCEDSLSFDNLVENLQRENLKCWKDLRARFGKHQTVRSMETDFIYLGLLRNVHTYSEFLVSLIFGSDEFKGVALGAYPDEPTPSTIPPARPPNSGPSFFAPSERLPLTPFEPTITNFLGEGGLGKKNIDLFIGQLPQFKVTTVYSLGMIVNMHDSVDSLFEYMAPVFVHTNIECIELYSICEFLFENKYRLPETTHWTGSSNGETLLQFLRSQVADSEENELAVLYLYWTLQNSGLASLAAVQYYRSANFETNEQFKQFLHNQMPKDLDFYDDAVIDTLLYSLCNKVCPEPTQQVSP